ncbi:hypothetical protein ACFQX4_25025 [Roseomonas sp. GCM10028921]
MRDPPYFGTARVLVEAQLGLGGGQLLLGPGLSLPLAAEPGLAGRRVVALRAGAGGAVSARVLWAGAAPGAPASGRSLGERAPMPDRGFESRRGLERDTGGRWTGGPGRAEPEAGRGESRDGPVPGGRGGEAGRSREGGGPGMGQGR